MGACWSQRSTCLGITQALTFPQDCFAGIVQIFTKLCPAGVFINWHELSLILLSFSVPIRTALACPESNLMRDGAS